MLLAVHLIAETAKDLQSNNGNLIFMGVFFLALIGVGIWWLRRG